MIALRQTNIPILPDPYRGKVRDVYDLNDMPMVDGKRKNHLLLAATDRISVYDVVLPTGIPRKGEILTAMSVFWIEKLDCRHNLVTADFPELIRLYPDLGPYADQLEGRFMLVANAKRLDAECIVRGNITGSGWKSYGEDVTICGISLPEGLLESQELPEILFTPSTKAAEGHDENINFERLVEIIGLVDAETVRKLSLDIFKAGRKFAASKGIIIADTKFEFGVLGEEIVLIDEVLTPDSSRFWPLEGFEPGHGQPSFDKQFVRDYTTSLGWNKTAPGPELPADIVEKTTKKYWEALNRLTE